MQRFSNPALVLVACWFLPAVGVRVVETPMARVVGLLQGLQARIEEDGEAEQRSYDKYACWCEDTLGRKANDISAAKEAIESAETKIKELKAEIASHGEEIKNVKADIASNIESQREATEMRGKEKMEYTDKKTESEQCIGALEAAINVLTAGTKKGFLETLQEAKLLSVAAGIRGVLANSQATQATSGSDLRLAHQFVDHPEEFLGGGAGGMSAVQIAANPFGDYAPQSTQIQGILKGMYDTFSSGLEKANVDEAEAQKAFQEIMATKKAELGTLQLTLDKQTLAEAQKTKDLADTSQLKDDTQAQLEADLAFFSSTKTACKSKASEWSERSRLRTEELVGVRKAIEILSSPEAKDTFGNATTSFLELASASSRKRLAAYQHLQALAREHHSAGLAKLATEVKEGGHFDTVIAAIDKMIGLLRREEQADIHHRDRCQGSQFKNKNDIEDIGSAIDKSNQALARMGDEKRQLVSDIDTVQGEINQTKDEMDQALGLRNDERAAFVKAVQDDTEAVSLLSQAIASLNAFYTRNKIPLGLSQQPTYAEDPNKPPETIWEGADYSGRTSESTGIIAILKMLQEDLQKEMDTARADDASAQGDYETSRAEARKLLEKQTNSKATLEKKLSDLNAKMFDTEEYKDQKGDDLTGEQELQAALYTDCSWVDTHFESRRTKRKAEIDGLNEAKAYLAGVESGTELEP